MRVAQAKSVHLQPVSFYAISKGGASLLVRPGYPAIKSYGVSQRLELRSSNQRLTVYIWAIRSYASLSAMLQAEDWRLIRPDLGSQDAVLSFLNRLYSNSTQDLGIFVFDIRPDA